MARIYLLDGKLGIKTDFANLWNRTLIGPRGSTLLSARENTIVSHVLLRPGIRWSEMIGFIWPNPDDEPGFAYNCMVRGAHFMARTKMRPIGLRFNDWKGACQHDGKWIEPIP